MRIGAHLTGFERQLLNRLAEVNSAASTGALRLATGRKVNSPSDDPAAFFAISSVESRLAVVNSTIPKVEAAASVAAQAQLALDQIRTQLGTIRTALLADEDGSLTAGERLEKQQAVDAALAQIGNLAGTQINGRRMLDGSADFTYAGLDNNQIDGLTVYAIGGPTVSVAERQAQLAYTGNNRTISADANITITGNGGETTVDVLAGQSLQSVAESINVRSGATGVTATTEDNELLLTSTSAGATARVQLAVNTGTFAVAGGDATGTAFGVDAQVTDGAAVAGSVDTAATRGTLTYTGAAGQTTGAATITLSGKLGSTDVAVGAAQDLTDLRDNVNQYSHATGITASVAGDDLTFTTVHYGTAATIDVDVSSGTFTTAGGNGDGTAQGTNAVATINGRTYTGNSPDAAATLVHTELTGALAADTSFRLTGNDGFFDFSFNTDDTLADVAAAIEAEKATTGVTASVSADGLDLILQSVTQGDQSQVQLQVTDGPFDVAAGAGSTTSNYTAAGQAELYYTSSAGNVGDTVEIRVTGELGFADVTLTAGTSLAAAADAINDEMLVTGVQARVASVTDPNDTLVLFSTGADANASVDVAINSGGPFVVTGGDGAGHATGADAVTDVRGAAAVTDVSTVDGTRFSVNSTDYRFTVEFDPSFTGTFDTVSLSDGSVLKFALATDLRAITRLAIPGALAGRLGGVSGSLDQLATGNPLSGLAQNTSQAIRVVDEALAQLTLIEGRVDGFNNAAVTSSANLLDGLKSTLEDSVVELDGFNEEEETLLLAKNQILASNILSALNVLQQQRLDMIGMIKTIAGLS